MPMDREKPPDVSHKEFNPYFASASSDNGLSDSDAAEDHDLTDATSDLRVSNPDTTLRPQGSSKYSSVGPSVASKNASSATTATVTTFTSPATTPGASATNSVSKRPTMKNASSNMTVEAETVAAVPTVAVAAADTNIPPPPEESTDLEAAIPSSSSINPSTETDEYPQADPFFTDPHLLSDDSNVYLDEPLPSGMQTPQLAQNALLAGATAGLKMKKSVDNVPSNTIGGTSSNMNTVKRQKKKKSSRMAGGGTKAEIFAARIARAVNEVDSSDSDETFVYDSNPHTDANNASSGAGSAVLASSGTMPRPRFQSRNMSTSSLSMVEGATLTNSQQPAVVSALTSTATSTPAVTTPPLVPGIPRRGSSHQFQQQRNLHHPISSTESELDSATLPPPRLLQHKSSASSPFRKASSSPRPSGMTAIHNTGPIPQPPALSQLQQQTATGANNGRNSLKHSNHNSVNSQLPLPNLRGKPSRMFAVAAANNSNSNSGTNKNSRRWRNPAAVTGYMEEDDDDDDEAEGDIDDDNYLDVTESTPLRHGIHGGQPDGAHGGVSGGSLYGSNVAGGTGPNGRKLRLSRKNGGIIVYSPHNYQQQRATMGSRYYYVRLMLWFAFFLVFVVGFGFILGFLYATSKPLQDVKFSQVFDVLASDDELAFELVLTAVNPGLLAVQIEKADLDVFAKSPYVEDPDDSNGGWFPGVGGGGDSATAHTMKLGNIKEFDVPIIFEGGFFNRRQAKAIGDVRLLNPGLNSTIEDDGAEQDWKSKSPKKPKDDDEDAGQKRWSRVSVHPFDLTVRGVLRYELFMGRSKSVSVAKTLRVDPNKTGGDGSTGK